MSQRIPSEVKQPRARGRDLALALAGLLAAVLLGAAWLFGGSQVTCEELENATGFSLSCAFDVAAPQEAVWRAFTATDRPQRHYFDAVLQAEMRPGGRWRFVTDDLERLLADGEILTLKPPRRFEQTFRAADLDDPPSRIAVEIESTSSGCHVTLVHDGFDRKTETYRRFRRAHPLALSALGSLVEQDRLPLRARIYTLIFKPAMKTFTVRAETWSSLPESTTGQVDSPANREHSGEN